MTAFWDLFAWFTGAAPRPERGVYRIKRSITALERRRMRAEAEALSTALERDLIDADDFARRPVAR